MKLDLLRDLKDLKEIKDLKDIKDDPMTLGKVTMDLELHLFVIPQDFLELLRRLQGLCRRLRGEPRSPMPSSLTCSRTT